MKLALLLAVLGQAQTTVGDSQFTGQLGVNTPAPQARFEARMAAEDEYGLFVSSQNGQPLFLVNKLGRAGVGVSSPVAGLDVRGSGGDSDIGLQLRAGNSSSSYSSSQLVFALVSSDTHRHSLRTRHAEGQNIGNSIDFFLWRATNTPSLLGGVRVLSLEGSASASSGTVHVNPFGTGVKELVVSTGTTTGGGTIHAAQVFNPSSRDLKRQIAYLGANDLKQAYEDLKALRHVRFRYKGDSTVRRGLIFEDSPASIKDPSGGLIVNERMANLEMALQHLNNKLIELDRLIEQKERERR